MVLLGAPRLAPTCPLLQRRPRLPVLEACGRQEAPVSKLFRLQREGLEKDFSPVIARLLGPGAMRKGRQETLLLMLYF